MNSVSPDTSRPSIRKHCEPGVCPGVCMNVSVSRPIFNVSWLSTFTRSEPKPLRNSRSALCTYTLAFTRSSRSSTPGIRPGMPHDSRLPPTWSWWVCVTSAPVMVMPRDWAASTIVSISHAGSTTTHSRATGSPMR